MIPTRKQKILVINKKQRIYQKVRVMSFPIARDWYIDLLIYHKNQPNVGKCTSPMDGMGLVAFLELLSFKFFWVYNFLPWEFCTSFGKRVHFVMRNSWVLELNRFVFHTIHVPSSWGPTFWRGCLPNGDF